MVLLDRIILEILVTAVAIEQQAPGRIALTNPAQQREAYRRAFDVEGFVVLDHPDRVLVVNVLERDLDRLEKQAQTVLIEEARRLARVGRVPTDRERERLETRR